MSKLTTSKKTAEQIVVLPIRVPKKFGKFNLADCILREVRSQGEEIKNGDIIVVSSKFAAMSEGRYINLSRLVPSDKATDLASRYDLDPAFAELIVRESDEILGGIPGFALAISNGILAPNAGIDRSNVPPGFAILYPKDPRLTAKQLRKQLLNGSSKLRKIGVILSDSRLTPTRVGTIGIAIATSGFKPVVDFRGKRDLFGNELKVTLKAVADQLSSAAELVMGEASESIPVVIIRGYEADFDERGSLSMLISTEKDFYIQGLKNSY